MIMGKSSTLERKGSNTLSNPFPDPQKPLVIVIAGPTASGKTATAIKVAQTLGGEIISADSMQIYQGMDIGTAKATSYEQSLVPHHLIDIQEPHEPFSVAAWLSAAQTAITRIHANGHIPIVCGGTGQYISALMDGLRFTPTPSDPALRAQLNQRAEEVGNRTLLQEIDRFDPETAARLHENDRKRIVRALEVYHLTGKTQTELNRDSRTTESEYRFLGFCLWLDRSLLYDRINQRVDRMMAEGLAEEVRHLKLDLMPESATCRQAIGYKEMAAHLAGSMVLRETIDLIKQSSRQYAKRQMTWFRRMPHLIGLEGPDPDRMAQAIVEAYQENH